eukprot:jgi/Undpi1/9395/HiC_scaffold_27.g11852.m1
MQYLTESRGESEGEEEAEKEAGASSGACPGILRRAAGRRWHTTVGPSFEYRQRLPEDPTPRKTCTQCGFVNYENPKVVCGSVLTLNGEDGSSDNDFIVLGRRNIQPRQGYWGIPAGTYFDV